MKFLVDLPLGGLCKWLRFCGFDAAYRGFSPRDPETLPPPAPDTYLVTNRGALRRLNRPDVLIVTAATPEAQLQEVLDRLGLTRGRLSPLSRCGRCNDLLRPISRDLVQGLVPEHVFYSQQEFYECPGCRRLYWPGSHLANIGKKLAQVVPSAGKERGTGRPLPDRRGS